jgi:hypothetical protein
MIEMRRQRIDYRSGKVAIIRRTSMSYDRLMQVVAEQAMQRAMVQMNRRSLVARASKETVTNTEKPRRTGFPAFARNDISDVVRAPEGCAARPLTSPSRTACAFR